VKQIEKHLYNKVEVVDGIGNKYAANPWAEKRQSSFSRRPSRVA
jgi:hypothetical protein